MFVSTAFSVLLFHFSKIEKVCNELRVMFPTCLSAPDEAPVTSRCFRCTFFVALRRFLDVFDVFEVVGVAGVAGAASAAPWPHLPGFVATGACCRFCITDHLGRCVAGCYRLCGYVDAADVITRLGGGGGGRWRHRWRRRRRRRRLNKRRPGSHIDFVFSLTTADWNAVGAVLVKP